MGLLAFLYNFFDEENKTGLHRRLLPFMSIFTSIWIMLFLQAWKRREKVLAYKIETLDTGKSQTHSRDFSGRYEINSDDNTVIQTNKFATDGRRLIWEIPNFVFFSAIAIIVTLLFMAWVDILDLERIEGKTTQSYHNGMIVVASILEAMSMHLLNWIYR